MIFFLRNGCLECKNEIEEESYFIWTNAVPVLLNLVCSTRAPRAATSPKRSTETVWTTKRVISDVFLNVTMCSHEGHKYK